MERSLGSAREKLYESLLSIYCQISFQVCLWGEVNGMRCTKTGRVTPHTCCSAVLLEGLRCPGRMGPWTGACGDCPADSWARKPWARVEQWVPYCEHQAAPPLKECMFLSVFEIDYLPTWHSWALRVLLWVSAPYLALWAGVLAEFCLWVDSLLSFGFVVAAFAHYCVILIPSRI